MRVVTLVGFALIGAAIVGFQAWGRLGRRTMTAGDLVGRSVRWPPARLLLSAGWLWLGWHLFVRVEL